AGQLPGNKRTFRKYGKSGIEVSHLLPRTAQCIDDIAVVRSCYGDMVVHSAAQYQLFTGRVIPGFPSMGAWTIYGLGSESESLPAYVVLPDPHGAQEAGQPMYSNGFLPAVYQPTMFRPGSKPVLHLDLPKGVRFVCPVSGGGTGNLQWDAHDNIEENHLRMAAQTDQPVAALLKDLKRRGLLDTTLVVWGGEFGRSPESQGSKGRDHHNLGF